LFLGLESQNNFLFTFQQTPQAGGAPNLPAVFPEGGRNTSLLLPRTALVSGFALLSTKQTAGWD